MQSSSGTALLDNAPATASHIGGPLYPWRKHGTALILGCLGALLAAFTIWHPVSVPARSNPEVWDFVRRCAPQPVRVYRFLGDFYAAYPGATLVRFRGEDVSMRSPSGLYELEPIDSIMVLDCGPLPTGW